MKSLTETDFKYLAGLIDADGWISFQFNRSKYSTGKTYLNLSLGLAASDTIDREGKFMEWLVSHCGNLSSYRDINNRLIRTWNLGKRSDLAQFIPRLTKHMVIKAKHIDRLFGIFCNLQGKNLTESETALLRATSVESRLDTGPLKAKNFCSKAWTAGFLDGDGHYGIHKKKQTNYTALSIDALVSESDRCALELLKKTYGGEIHYQDGNPRWYRGLGKQHHAFAIRFLKTMHRHSRLKRHKIEQMLAFHNWPQRLTESTPTGEVIV